MVVALVVPVVAAAVVAAVVSDVVAAAAVVSFDFTVVTGVVSVDVVSLLFLLPFFTALWLLLLWFLHCFS